MAQPPQQQYGLVLTIPHVLGGPLWLKLEFEFTDMVTQGPGVLTRV